MAPRRGFGISTALIAARVFGLTHVVAALLAVTCVLLSVPAQAAGAAQPITVPFDHLSTGFQGTRRGASRSAVRIVSHQRDLQGHAAQLWRVPHHGLDVQRDAQTGDAHHEHEQLRSVPRHDVVPPRRALHSRRGDRAVASAVTTGRSPRARGRPIRPRAMRARPATP